MAHISSNIMFSKGLWMEKEKHFLVFDINSIGNTETILLLLNKDVRLCTNSSFRDHTNPLFLKLKTLKVDDIYILQTGIFMFQLNNRQLPPYFPHSLI